MEQAAANDPVNHPSHYTFGKYEVLDVLQDWFPVHPLLWQVVKYVARANHKGSRLQDLRKAEFYLQRQIAELEGVAMHQINLDEDQKDAIRSERIKNRNTDYTSNTIAGYNG